MRKSNYFVRNLEGDNYVESLLIAAIATILGIRFFLDITGYPQVGGGGLHIAHMLWGGLLMLVAIFLLLSFLNRSLLHAAAILGGIGFGTFIDELGKFITSDNNYFFEPTFGILYIIFIVLFLLLRFFEKRHVFSHDEYLENAFELTREAVLNGNRQLGEKALVLIKSFDTVTPIGKHLEEMLKISLSQSPPKDNIFSVLSKKSKLFYTKIVQNVWFLRGVIFFFILFSLYNLWKAVAVISLFFRLNEFSLSYIEWGKFISSIVSSLIIIIGIFLFKFSHVRGYKIFKLGVLFSLLVTQFFDFYDNQFTAAGIFLINIMVLVTLNTIIEKQRVDRYLLANTEAVQKG